MGRDGTRTAGLPVSKLLSGSTACEMLAYQAKYYTEDYNIMYGFGGLELMDYNYDDAEWAEFVASQNGELSYE